MFKNRMALRLTLYFLVAILTFSFVMGVGFTIMFERYISGFHKEQFIEHARAIANNISKYMDINNDGDDNYDDVLSYAIDISVNNLWIIDKHNHILANYHGKPQILNIRDLTLPQTQFLSKILDGETLYSNEFNNIVSNTTITIGVPATSKDGKVIGAVLLHTDFNSRKTAFEQIELPLFTSIGVALSVTFILSFFLSKKFTEPIINKEAEDALRLENTRREFVATISHELRTPVTVIRGSLETLINKIPIDTEQLQEYHRQMLIETLFLQRLISDLLDLAKLQNIEFVIEKTEISLNDILADVARSSRAIAKENNVKVVIHEANKDCVIFGDYGRIRQMLMIVIDNAIKFSPQNSKVMITLKDNYLSICDNGAGISSEDLPYIFDKFYKGSLGKEKSGTGLGLVIAKQIADRHGISIEIKSNEHQGTIFTFKL